MKKAALKELYKMMFPDYPDIVTVAQLQVMLVQNVASKVDRPRKNDFQPVFLSAEEMKQLFEVIKGTISVKRTVTSVHPEGRYQESGAVVFVKKFLSSPISL